MFVASLRRSRGLFGCLLGGWGLLSGCTHPLPSTEYRAYLVDPTHGLTHTTEAGGATLTCTYRPLDLLVLQDLAALPASTAAVRDSLARAYAGKTYCTLTLARNGGEIENQFINDPVAYQQALAYLNTGLGADTYLASTGAQDSVRALTSMYVREYGTTGHSTVLVVFDTHQLSLTSGFTLTWHDRQFGLGTQRFAFTASNLAAVPALRYE